MGQNEKAKLFEDVLRSALPNARRVVAYAIRNRIVAGVELPDRELYMSGVKLNPRTKGWRFDAALHVDADDQQHFRHDHVFEGMVQHVTEDIGVSTDTWYGFRPLGCAEETIGFRKNRNTYSGDMTMHEVLFYLDNNRFDLSAELVVDRCKVWEGRYDKDLTGIARDINIP